MQKDYTERKKENDMKPSEKYKLKKRISAGIAILLAITLVVSLIAPFIGYGIY